jgi:hypothetical protein
VLLSLVRARSAESKLAERAAPTVCVGARVLAGCTYCLVGDSSAALFDVAAESSVELRQMGAWLLVTRSDTALVCFVLSNVC